MARMSRVEVFAADEIAIVHVMNRTVRRCFLLGDDPVSRQNYDHRKVWIDEQLVHQARYFGIDLLCQAILSNHVHLVLRSRPDVVQERSGRPGPDANREGTRCSNKGFLAMSTAEYLTLLDWTARQQRADKSGATPHQFAPLFERLGISAETWWQLVRNFGRLFSVVAGKPTSVDSHCSRSGSHRYRTKRTARELMATV